MNRRQFTMAAFGAGVAAAAPFRAAASRDLPTSNDFWKWDATDVAQAVKAKKVSAREVTMNALERVNRVNPKVNAIVESLADEALAAADQADRAVSAGGPLGPLHGVPVTTKINVDLKGHPTTNGLVALKNNIAKDDSSPVRAMRQAGAIIIGRTNTPAMSFRWFTDNDLHGRTLNPWNRTITPGGSSGGAGAAVAAGLGALAHGNDIAGSVRYPGYVCGVPALRPSLGRIASYQPGAASAGGISGQIMGVQGVLGRRVEDVWLGTQALSARDTRDSWWTPAPLSYPAEKGPLKVALFSQSPHYQAHPSVAAALSSAAASLAKAGYIVEEKSLPHFEEGARLWSKIVMNENRNGFVDAIISVGDAKVRKEVLAWLEITPEVNLEGFSEALARRAAIGQAWNALLEDYALILMPNSWDPPFEVDRDQGGPEAMREILRVQSPMLLPPLLGLPGLSVPTGLYKGVPAGVQLVAGRYREDRCIAAGAVIERDHPMPTPIDPRF